MYNYFRHNKIFFSFLIDKTSNTIQWLLYFLTSNPETLARLEQEVLSVVGADVTPAEEHLTQMPYVKAAIKETLRFRLTFFYTIAL